MDGEDLGNVIMALLHVAWTILVVFWGYTLFQMSTEQVERLIDIEQQIELLLEDKENEDL